MIKKDFRTTKNRAEILKTLNAKFMEAGGFTLWQKDPETGVRTISTEVKFDSLNIREDIFSIIIADQYLNKIKKDIDTYFLLKHHDFAFKTKLSSISTADPHMFFFKIPKDIHLEELRKHPRKIVDPNEKANMGVVFIDKNTLLPIHTVCPIINISHGGICLMLSSDVTKKIDIDKEVELHPITTFPEIRFKTKAAIKNVRLFSKKTFMKDEFFAIGLQFILNDSF